MTLTLPDLMARDRGAVARPTLKILVVDDHEGARRALQLLLRRLNCKIEVAEDGQEALRLLRQGQYDLVFMDLMMPVMDGLTATLQIRQERPAGAGPRIIGISADSDAETRELCLAVGMDDFLPKPLQEAELSRILQEASLEAVRVDNRAEFATSVFDATPMAAPSIIACLAVIESVVVWGLTPRALRFDSGEGQIDRREAIAWNDSSSPPP